MALDVHKCPKCSSINISYDSLSHKYKCNNCGNVFSFEEKSENNLFNSLETFQNNSVNITSNSLVSYKCPNCLTSFITHSSTIKKVCPWCNYEVSDKDIINSLNTEDFILPFSVSKEDAETEMKKFVDSRSLFANPKFKSNFSVENIKCVYFPYLVANYNANANFKGFGEKNVKSYSMKFDNGKTHETKEVYDADLFSIDRSFDISINGLLSSISNIDSNDTFNDIIPFDIENVNSFNPNFLINYSAFLSNINIDSSKEKLKVNARSITRHNFNDTITGYDRGVRLENMSFNIISADYKKVYLPVYFYSYSDAKDGKGNTYYVILNGRNKSVSGNVPFYIPRVILFTAILLVLSLLLGKFSSSFLSGLVLIGGFSFIIYLLYKYKGGNKSNNYLNTSHTISNAKSNDVLVKREEALENDKIEGENLNNFDDYSISKDKLSSSISNIFDKFRK